MPLRQQRVHLRLALSHTKQQAVKMSPLGPFSQKKTKCQAGGF